MALVFLLVLNFLWTFTSGDADVSCVFMKSCILPCSFQPGSEVVIHWIQLTAGSPVVHSYYYNQDQIANQDQRFKGRTSLFKDQISAGNASLQLTGVKVQDETRYKCYTSTVTGNKESFINLKVDAPVSKIDLEQVGNMINCSSEGIYPQPDLTWSIDSPSTPTVQRTEQQLFNISSSLILSDDVPDVVYSCTVSTRSNKRTATLLKLSSVSGTITGTTTITCADSKTAPQSIIWRFNHSQVIVTHTGPNKNSVSERWRPYVKDVTDTGSLTLQDLSLDQTGVYTCKLSNAEETHVTNTFLELREGSSNAGLIAGVIVAVLVLVPLVGIGIYFIIGRIKEETNKKDEEKGKESSPSETDKLNS